MIAILQRHSHVCPSKCSGIEYNIYPVHIHLVSIQSSRLGHLHSSWFHNSENIWSSYCSIRWHKNYLNIGLVHHVKIKSKGTTWCVMALVYFKLHCTGNIIINKEPLIQTAFHFFFISHPYCFIQSSINVCSLDPCWWKLVISQVVSTIFNSEGTCSI